MRKLFVYFVSNRKASVWHFDAIHLVASIHVDEHLQLPHTHTRQNEYSIVSKSVFLKISQTNAHAASLQ